MSKYELNDYVRFGKLFAIYGKLLSLDRQKIMAAYFDYNMTLAEIAKERGVSRQAILDSINKSCEKLENFETLLGLSSLKEELSNALNEIANLEKDKQVKLKVEKLIRKL